jgi:hypothetical protein
MYDVCSSGIELRGRTRCLLKCHGGPGMIVCLTGIRCLRPPVVLIRLKFETASQKCGMPSRLARMAPVSPQAHRVRPFLRVTRPGRLSIIIAHSKIIPSLRYTITCRLVRPLPWSVLFHQLALFKDALPTILYLSLSCSSEPVASRTHGAQLTHIAAGNPRPAMTAPDGKNALLYSPAASPGGTALSLCRPAPGCLAID